MIKDNNNHTPTLDYALGENSITILHQGKPNIITSDRVNYRAIINAVKEDNKELVFELLDEAQTIISLTEGRVRIEGQKVYFDDQEIHGALVNKLTHMLESGFTNLTGWMKFTEKLMSNPSMKSREQSYPFIARTDILITENGNCKGYKGVRNDFRDKYSGNFDNSPGMKHKMPRRDVDDDVDNGCSYGFHIGSHKYADGWGGSDGKLMIVEFNPKHIVSVPHCSNHEKLRVCKYKVLEECTDRQVLKYTNGNHDDTDHDLFEFIYDKCNAKETVSLNDIQQQYPEATMSDIISLGESRPEYRISHQFNDDFMDYDISVEYTD